MGEEWEQDPLTGSNQSNQDELEKSLGDFGRKLVKGTNEVQSRLKRVFNKASNYWQNAQTSPMPRQPNSVEEQRIRQLVDGWSNENWKVARDLGTYMDAVSWTTDEIWEVTLDTRWETRTMEVVSDPYTGTNGSTNFPQPLLPVWDYKLPAVAGLRPPQTRTRIDGLDEIVSCTICNSTGHTLCSNCKGRGWIVCPECKGRIKKQCTNCRGRGYVADWTPGEKKSFIRRNADNMANALGNKVSDVFDGIRQQGIPIPNPLDSDPKKKGDTIPCPECSDGEVECSCRNGKIVCVNCEGAKTILCASCGGTGKRVRHREIVRRFDVRTQTRLLGQCPIPPQQLLKATGDLAYSTEVNETLHREAPPDRVPIDIWQNIIDLAQEEAKIQNKPGIDSQTSPRPTLQTIKLVHIPYKTVHYRYNEENYTLFIYDSEGKEKFSADRAPARWDRVERLVKAISTDLLSPASAHPPVEASYSVSEEEQNP